MIPWNWDRRTDRQTDSRTDRWADRRTDRQKTDIYLTFIGYSRYDDSVKLRYMYRQTDGQTVNRQMDRQITFIG